MATIRCVVKRFSMENTNIKASFSTDFIADKFYQELRSRIDEKGGKKGYELEPEMSPFSAEQFIIEGSIIRVDEGNRLARYAAGFAGMAIVEVSGHIFCCGNKICDLHYTSRITGGAFGGDSQKLLETAAKDAAKKIAKQIIKTPYPNQLHQMTNSTSQPVMQQTSPPYSFQQPNQQSIPNNNPWPAMAHTHQPYCDFCGGELSPNASFCGECGRAVSNNQ